MSTSVPAPHAEKLLLLPFVRALEELHGGDVRVALLTPPYPCVGIGELRVVRVGEQDGATKLDLSYENYERLE